MYVQHSLTEYKKWEAKLKEALLEQGIELDKLSPNIVKDLDLDWMYSQRMWPSDAAEMIHVLIG